MKPDELNWDAGVLENFERAIAKMPVFDIIEENITKQIKRN